ncbi:MAG: oxidoreductase [Chromatiales bacterium]|jgi:uncharacterized protein (DUF934 family)|nr:oxidoreductase [Chromatiales bacterium]MDP6150998.1 DUF934 domain-containing protein [Gammaproteobacteria bacterium]MDP7271159.1 DUF934 domain-containing protein [Gammaproteobacteria bacterium]HJP04250.1 DUF934 domain-containing protein [Gammaproteobacteria bacterium]
MALFNEGGLAEDLFSDVSIGDELPAKGTLIVSLNQWRENRDKLIGRSEPLGIRLKSDEKPEEISADLRHFSVIALEFPAFRDGRAYSYARLLRERYGYTGELRAVGDVLLEQLHFMHRVGFNAFSITDDDAMRAWEIAAADFSVWYQPTGDGRASVMALRHGRR